MKYFASHWRGELSLPKPFLLNGLVAYIVLIVGLVSLGRILTFPGFTYFGIAIFAAWAVWAAVGIVRCSFRVCFSPESASITRACGFFAIVIVALAVALIVRDVWNLIAS